jgi:outer membrane receptor for monomeric catechols
LILFAENFPCFKTQKKVSMKTNLKPIAIAIAGVVALAGQAFAADTINASKVTVYSGTPLPGIGLTLNKVPANIQVADPKQINNQGGVSIADYMMNNMQGVTVSEMGGNPWQPEINFRGFSSSPLTGNAQGLSTYIDGVRVNEPFGDVTLFKPRAAVITKALVLSSKRVHGVVNVH